MTGRFLLTLLFLLAVSACADPAPLPDTDEAVARTETRAPTERSDAGTGDTAPAEIADEPSAERPSPPSTSATPPTGPGDGRYAVLIGIDDYPGEDSDLPSGARDVAAMRTLLIGRFGYQPDRILTLSDRRATRDAIRRAIRAHLSRADASALLYLSGHGVRLDGNTGRADAERDGRDEAVYVWANDGRHGTLIADDEIGAWMGALTARHAVVVLDACHSGTGARGRGRSPAIKEVKLADIEARLDPAAPWTRPVRPGGRPVVLLAAARDQEIAFAGVDGRPSLFTDALVTVLNDVAPSTPLADAMRQVSSRVRAASRTFGSEHRPQLEGGSGLALADLLSR